MIIDSSNMDLVYDSEANGLLHHQGLRMWCIVAEDYETGIQYLFHDFPEFNGVSLTNDDEKIVTLPIRNGTLEEGVHFLNNARSLICHNQLGYDQFLMKMFYPWFNIRFQWPEVRDTMLESQVQFYDRPRVKGFKGIHGLEPWGARFKVYKPVIKDWSKMTPYILNRCLEDVTINTKTARYLAKEREQLLENCGLRFEEALNTEQEYRYWSTIQELNGAKIDKPHMEKCVVELDVMIDKLRVVIEPQLPPTLKIKGTKETVHEVKRLLGFPKSERGVIKYEVRLRNGVAKEYPIKNLYKPVTKYQKTTKGKLYAVAIGDDMVTEHIFFKLKDARDFGKTLDIPKGTKVKYPNIETELVEYNSHTKEHFADELGNTLEVIGPHTKVSWEKSKMSQHGKVKELLVGLGWQTDEWTFKKDFRGQFERAKCKGKVVWPDFRVNGNQLEEVYKKGDRIPQTPKLSDDSYDTLPEGVGQTIGEYNTYSHRRKFIQNPTDGAKGLLNNIRPDGRITCGLMSFGTSAGRAAQYGWVNAPSVQALYGENIRKIIVAPADCTLVGVDMPSAHPRILADPYCTGNDKFIAAVDGVESYEDKDGTVVYVGEDFHTVNAVLFGLCTQEQVDEARRTQSHDLIAAMGIARKIGKGGSYCTLYGGSDKKLAITIGIELSKGATIKQTFLNGLGLDALLEEVEASWNSQKRLNGSYISVLGGYHIWSNSKHKIINYKALGSEAVIQKHAVIWVNREIRKLGLKTKQICNVHDELLFEVPNSELEQFKVVVGEMYHNAATNLGLVLDWHSAAMVGQTYADCH